jgi:hypothetical protein
MYNVIFIVYVLIVRVCGLEIHDKLLIEGIFICN